MSELWGFSHTTESTSPQTRITIYNCFGTYSSKSLALSDMIDRYTKVHPDIDINNGTMPSDIFYSKLHSDFSAGCAADIIIAPPGYDTEKLYDRGYLANLSNDISSDSGDVLDFDKSFLKLSSRKGNSLYNAYGLPFDAEYILLYCNNELFEQNGVKIPESYTEFKDAISRFAELGITPVAAGADDDNMYLYQTLCSMYSDSVSTTGSGVVWDNTFTPAAEQYKELYDMGAFSVKYKDLTLSNARQLFTEGKAAMIVDSSDFVNEIMQYANSDDTDYMSYINKIGVYAFPLDGGDPERPSFSTVPYNAGEFTVYVNKSAYETKHDQIFDFIKYMCKSDTMRVYLAHTNDIITVKSISNRDYVNPLTLKCTLAVENATKFTQLPANSMYRQLWISHMCRKLPSYLYGDETIEKITADIQKMSALTDFRKGVDAN